MGLRINSNIASLNAYRNLSVTDGQLTRSLEKLSSGFRISRAADDASGLAISEGLRTQIGGLKVAARNTQDGISVAQTAEGALTETHSILQRMRDLSVQAANTGGLDDYATGTIQAEINSLVSELDRIAAATSWNGTKLLDGSFDTMFQTGANVSETIAVTIGTAVTAAGLGLGSTNVGADGGAYRFNPAFGAPGLGEVTVVTSAVTSPGSGVLNFADPDGAHFSGPAASADAYLRLDGVIGFGGRSFDLSSVTYDLSADTDASGTVDADDLLAQLNDAATSAFGVLAPPFVPGTDRLGFSISDSEAAFSHLLPVNAGASAAEIARATPTFGSGGATAAIRSIDDAIATVSTIRANLGAIQNRFEHTVDNLTVAVENLTASESRIRDADMAQEMVRYTRNQILSQAGTAMLTQAGRTSQAALTLLR